MISRLLPLPPTPDTGIQQPAWLPRVYKIGIGLLIPLTLFYFVEAIDYFRGLDGLIAADKRFLGRDFANWWTAARLTLDGDIMTLFDLQLYHQAQVDLFGYALEIKNWSYPPHVIPWALWLGLLPYSTALVLWTIMGFLAYSFAVAYKRPQAWMLTLILVLAPSSCIDIIEGQTGFFTAACLVGGLRLLDDEPVLAGILLGILSFKPHFGFLVPVALLAGRYWRVIVSATFTAALLVGIGVFLFGTEPWVAYYEKTMPLQKLILEKHIGMGVYQDMMISPFMAVRILGGSLVAAYAITAAAAILSVASVIVVFMRSSSLELRSAVTITATFFASPYMFTYDTPALSAAMIAMIMYALGQHETARGGRPLQPLHLVLFLILWTLPLVTISLSIKGLPLYPLAIGTLLFVQLQWVMRPFYPHSSASRTPV